MLNRLDDYFVHQGNRPLDEATGSGALWQEALYFNLHSADGRCSAIGGLDVFPNSGFAVAWLMVERTAVISPRSRPADSATGATSWASGRCASR